MEQEKGTEEIVEKTASLSGDFEAWITSKDYWERYLWFLHLTKTILDESDIEKCYQYMLEDSGASPVLLDRTTIILPVLDFGDTDVSTTNITLDKIENLNNVNAIDASFSIEFGKHITVIYGDNGAGKSGIGRLLSNACSSRKPRILLPNARESSSGTSIASCDFHISDLSGSRVINYSIGDIDKALKSFSVFDHECALVHLDKENNIEFIPSKIQIFEDVFKSIQTLENKLKDNSDIKKVDNPTDSIFAESSKITIFLGLINAKTTDKEIDSALEFTTADGVLLESQKKILAEKIKQDVSKQKKELQKQENYILNAHRLCQLGLGL